MPRNGVMKTGRSTNGVAGGDGVMVLTIADNYGTAIGHGDPVALASGLVVLCGESATPVGILRGIEYVDATGNLVRLENYPANTTNSGTVDGTFVQVKAFVEPVENKLFLMNTADAALVQANIGASFRLKDVGTVVNRLSTATVDLDATVSTETRLFRILEAPAGFGTGVPVIGEFVQTLGDSIV
jgi:hypothetical protein